MIDQRFMDQSASDLPSLEELQESIDELSAYQERLFQDVVGLGKKLRLSQKKSTQQLLSIQSYNDSTKSCLSL